MLDEIDKVGNDWRGDPSAAPRVLDPAQNNTFMTTTSRSTSTCPRCFHPTANVSETIPAPLLDRMELIRLDGYTEEEKVAIARDHLPAAWSSNPAQPGRGDGDRGRDHESDHRADSGGGCPQPRGELGKITARSRPVATKELTPPVNITVERVREFPGKPRFDNEVAARTAVPRCHRARCHRHGRGRPLVEATATDTNGHGSSVILTSWAT
jgi:ATP-dependent Lon protease